MDRLCSFPAPDSVRVVALNISQLLFILYWASDWLPLMNKRLLMIGVLRRRVQPPAAFRFLPRRSSFLSQSVHVGSAGGSKLARRCESAHERSPLSLQHTAHLSSALHLPPDDGWDRLRFSHKPKPERQKKMVRWLLRFGQTSSCFWLCSASHEGHRRSTLARLRCRRRSRQHQMAAGS